jgi:hypothetical protein
MHLSVERTRNAPSAKAVRSFDGTVSRFLESSV